MSSKKLQGKDLNKNRLKNSLQTPSSIPQAKTKKTFWAEITILIFGFLLYGNTISHNYALDDAIVIVQNQFTVKGVSGLKGIFSYDTFTGFWMNTYRDKSAKQIQEEKKLVAGGRYRPLSVASFALELQAFGKKEQNEFGQTVYIGNPHISHFINILLYVLTTILLYKILKKIIPPKPESKWYFSVAFIASILFLSHPVHTEAVANIKGRDEILTLLGSLAALWFTLKYLDTKKTINLLYSSLSLFLGLLSKENAITFLALIPLTVHFFSNHKLKNNFLALLPLLVASAVFLIIRFKVLGGESGEKEIAQELMNNPFVQSSNSEKYATIFYTLWKYIQILVFPHPLTYDYYPKQIPIINWGDFRAFLPFILYLAMGLYAVWGTIKKKNIYSYSIWFFLIPLSVVSNLFFPVGTFMNERFIFISSIGFCILLAWLLVEKLPLLTEKIKLKPFSITLPILLIVLVLYSGKTFTRNQAWKDDLTLFTTDVKVSYNSAKSTCSAGGKIIEYAQQPEIKADSILHRDYCLQAIQYLERSLEIYPEYADAQNLIGNAWYELELNSAKAILAYTEVLKHRPYHGVALGNVRIIINNAFNLLSSGNSVNTPQETLDALLILDSVKPGILELYHLVGTIYGRYLNDLNTSVMYLEKSAELNNPNHLLYLDMGVAYGMSGNLQKALENFNKAVQLNPNDAQAWLNLGYTYQQLGDMQNAVQCIAKGNQLMGN